MKIAKSILSNDTYEISLDEIETNPNLVERCSEIIKYFSKGDKLFFCLYREDGFLLSEDQLINYRKEIPEYFETNGSWTTLFDENNIKMKYFDSRILKAGSLPANDKTYIMLPRIFHYFLETICFFPKISWEFFEKNCFNYMKNGGRNYIEDGYTDVLFSYVDNGDFRITFNSSLYNVESVYNDILKILNV